MNKKQKIELEVLKNLLNEIKIMNPEYIENYIQEKIDKLKNGV